MDIFESLRNSQPPRHALESDSEDEMDPEDNDLASGSASTSYKKPAKEPIVRYESTDAEVSILNEPVLLVAIGDAGLAWSKGLDEGKLVEHAQISVDTRKVASLTVVASSGSTIAFVADDSSYVEMHEIAQCLLDNVHPSSLIVIDSYSIPSYLSERAAEPVIRSLGTTDFRPTVDVDSLEPPNMAQGLGAALTSAAYEGRIPTLLLLLPTVGAEGSGASVGGQGAGSLPAESIYDYGGPSPYKSSLLALPAVQAKLRYLADQLEWSRRFGWHLPSYHAAEPAIKSRLTEATNQAGFGWCKAKRVQGQRIIGEGAMYL